MAGIGAISDGYRRVASHRPQRGGHVSFFKYFTFTGLVVIDIVRKKPLANQRRAPIPSTSETQTSK